MHQLTLEWASANQSLSQTLSLEESTRIPGAIRIGRDSTLCDVVLRHPDPTVEKTVSGLHIEIFFNSEANRLYLRNLTRDRQPPKRPNPVVVDGKKIITEEVPLHTGSQIRLGKMVLTIKAIASQEQAASANQPQYLRVCANPQSPHYHPLDYNNFNCDVCGYVMLGATLIHSA